MARLNKQLTTILAGFCLKAPGTVESSETPQVAVRCLAFRAMRPKGSQSSPERTGLGRISSLFSCFFEDFGAQRLSSPRYFEFVSDVSPAQKSE